MPANDTLATPESRSKYERKCHPPVVLPGCGKLMAAFPVYVVLMRDAFEVKVEKRLVHGQACLHVLAFVNAFRATSLCEHLIDISIEGRALLRSRVPRI